MTMARRIVFTFTIFGLMPALLLLAAAFASPAFASTVRIVVPVHDITRGDTISESDLTYVMVDGAALMSGIATSLDEVKGMQARRTLSAGAALRTDDVRHPIVVVKGQTVTMNFSAPGVEVTAIGRAMSEGGVGDLVTVQNPASYRMISATVTAPGTVRVQEGAAIPPTSLTARR
jgi:flagellar basal body P-ring formation protein FlgA